MENVIKNLRKNIRDDSEKHIMKVKKIKKKKKKLFKNIIIYQMKMKKV